MDYQLSKMNIAITNGDSIRAPKKENGSCHPIREYRDPRDTTYYKESGTYQKAGVDYKVFKTDFERGKNVSPMKEY